MFRGFYDPHPDELLYSALARSGNRLRYPSKTTLIQEVFNGSTLTAVIDLPTHLEQFIENLPLGHRYDLDYLIDNHTLLPFYEPFLPRERYETIHHEMCRGGRPRARAALLKSPIPPLKYLRFCSACFEEDRKVFGEGYWHRIHQIPGVEVCEKHHIFLEMSTAKVSERGHPSEFISAEQAVRIASPSINHAIQPIHPILLDIVRQAAWLLSHPTKPSGIKDLHRRYHLLLIEKGITNFASILDMSEVLRAFKNHYPANLLQLLHCELDGRIGNWIARLLSSWTAQHPIQHLLFMNFLGCDVEQFFKMSVEYLPFGHGPWPCFNPVCGHYQQFKILTYELTLNVKSKRPVGTFSCECGFVYCRTGPDREEERFKISKVKSYGPVWEAKLRELWSDSNLELKQIKQMLNASATTIKCQAARMNLPFPRPGGRSKKSRLDYSRRAWVPSPALVSRRRAQWLLALEENPGVGLTVIRQKTQQLYPWLRTHDSEWLNQHLPETVQTSLAPFPPVNWKQRDIQLASEVRAAGFYLRSLPGRPVRIKRDTIGRMVGQSTTLRKEWHRLPLTAEALDEVVETPELFAIRQLEWATEICRQERFEPTRKQLIRKANIRGKENLPGVDDAIEHALNSLRRLTN